MFGTIKIKFLFELEKKKRKNIKKSPKNTRVDDPELSVKSEQAEPGKCK